MVTEHHVERAIEKMKRPHTAVDPRAKWQQKRTRTAALKLPRLSVFKLTGRLINELVRASSDLSWPEAVHSLAWRRIK